MNSDFFWIVRKSTNEVGATWDALRLPTRRGEFADLAAIRFEAQVLVEELHHMILKTVSHCAGVGARVDFKAIGDSVAVEDVMQLTRVDSQAVLIADIHRNCAILLEISDVLVDECQRRICCPFREYVGLGYAIFRGQI
jgi:hypothetical protein